MIPKNLVRFLQNTLPVGAGLGLAIFIYAQIPDIFAIIGGRTAAREGLAPFMRLALVLFAGWVVSFSIRLFFGFRSGRLLMDH